MPYKARTVDWYSRALNKWLLLLVEEIGSLTQGSELKKSVRSGALQDALTEIRRVLILANMDDLAYEALELKRMVDEIVTRTMVREGAYYQQVVLQNLRDNIRRFLSRAKNRALRR